MCSTSSSLPRRRVRSTESMTACESAMSLVGRACGIEVCHIGYVDKIEVSIATVNPHALVASAWALSSFSVGASSPS